MNKHSWVKIVITPIHVVDDPEVSSEPVILVTEVDEEEAKECAQYGCIRCDETLTSETVNSECEVPEFLPEDELTDNDREKFDTWLKDNFHRE